MDGAMVYLLSLISKRMMDGSMVDLSLVFYKMMDGAMVY
jgi:hypothetical protein